MPVFASFYGILNSAKYLDPLVFTALRRLHCAYMGEVPEDEIQENHKGLR